VIVGLEQINLFHQNCMFMASPSKLTTDLGNEHNPAKTSSEKHSRNVDSWIIQVNVFTLWRENQQIHQGTPRNLFCGQSAKMLRLSRHLSTTLVNATGTIRMASISAGLKGEANIVVETNRNTARHMKSGDLDVFATPSMVALMEQAACAALQSSLGPGETTVRKWLRFCTPD
jgi:hypothetical protein